MHPEEHPELAPRFRELTRSIRERWYIVVVCVLLTTAGALAWSLTRDKEYESTARLLVQQDEFESSVAGLDQNVAVDPERQTATDLELVDQPALAERVARRLDPPGDADELLGRVSAEADGNSHVLSITIRDDDPAQAADTATIYASEYVRFRARTDRNRYQRALRSIEGRLDEARAADAPSGTVRELRRQQEQVSLLLSLQSGGAEVIQRGTIEAEAVAPKPLRDALVAAAFGLLLGLLLAVGRDRLDPRLRDEREVEAMLPGVPVIAAIPDGPVDANGRPLEAEGFRGLQTTLSVLDADRSMRTVLVTSATMGEGKSLTSLNLALAMAEREESVLLVDADLRRRGLTERLGLSGRGGLGEVLAGTDTLSDGLVEVSLRDSLSPSQARGRGGAVTSALTGVVRVLPAGEAAGNPHALLAPAHLEQMMLEATAVADKVVVDGTPLGLVKDVLPVAQRADAVVVVARLHHTRKKELERLRDLLNSARIRPFGLVIFGIDANPAYDQYMRR